eukprot:scaffold84493_cov63-Phaeocystis_antarctica.AAC.3
MVPRCCALYKPPSAPVACGTVGPSLRDEVGTRLSPLPLAYLRWAGTCLSCALVASSFSSCT